MVRILPDADVVFFLRSGPVRAAIDRLLFLLNDRNYPGTSSVGSDTLSVAYSDLLAAATAFVRDRNSEHGAFGASDADTLSQPYPFNLVLWADRPASDVWSEGEALRSLFKRHMANNVAKSPCQLRSPSGAEAALIRQAMDWLANYPVPIVNEVVYNVRHLCVFDYEDSAAAIASKPSDIGISVSSHLVPSTCFFSRHALTSLEWAVESIYHEALHKKLSNTLTAHDILAGSYDHSIAPKFHSHWNTDSHWNPNRWELDRALYAFHVWFHLWQLYSTVCSTGDFFELDRAWCAHRMELSKYRANALLHWLQGEALTEFNQDGQKLLAIYAQYIN